MATASSGLTSSAIGLPLIRRIMTSRTYQLAATTRDAAVMADDLHHSHALVTPLEAEQLLDALVRVTGGRVRFAGYPVGLRANQVPAPPQTGRRFTAGTGDQFLKTFGKPERLLTCECERTVQPNIAQALHLLNGELLNRKIAAPAGRIEALLRAKTPPARVVEDLYLVTLSRRPRGEELQKALGWIAEAPTPREGMQDLLWVLLNSREFQFNH